jgi:hypothetical protein
MADPNRELLQKAIDVLGPLLSELVFVGGCVTGLLISDPAAEGIRPTRDVDTIVEATTYAQYVVFSERLKSLGLVEDISENAPPCRWRYGTLLLDVMPADERALSFSNRWYLPAIQSAQTVSLGGVDIRVITAPYFLATKLDAFHGRGGGDIAASHDLEDVITVIDGRSEIVDEIRNSDHQIETYVGSEIGRLITNPTFREALPGFLLPDRGSQARRPLLEGRLRAIAADHV